MAWTTPKTWIPGDVVTSTIMNEHIQWNTDKSFTALGQAGISAAEEMQVMAEWIAFLDASDGEPDPVVDVEVAEDNEHREIVL